MLKARVERLEDVGISVEKLQVLTKRLIFPKLGWVQLTGIIADNFPGEVVVVRPQIHREVIYLNILN